MPEKSEQPKDTSVVIERTQNGYVIHSTLDMRYGEYVPISQWFSFENFEAVVEWLTLHYTRPTKNTSDGM